MAGYNELKGLRVKYLSADPANPEDGQVWYNSTTGNLRVQGIGVGAWSSSSPLNIARNGLGTAGIQTAGLGFGGYNATPVQVTDTEEYNGSGWTSGGALNTARGQLTGFGTQTSAVAAGGSLVAGSPSPAPSPVYTNIAEEYNGTSWTTIPSMTTGRFLLASAGIETAGMAVGGRVSDTTFTNATEEYDGASWTAGGSMNTPAPLSSAIGGCGTLTAGLKFGGPAPTTNTEEYNGTSWTEVNNLNTGRERIAGAGIQTSALAIGGNPNIATTESYDGTSWTAVADLGTGRNDISATGASNTSALAFGGNLPPKTGATEEWNFSSTTVTAAAWSSGGALPSAKNRMASSGTQTATLSSGGYNAADTTVNTSEEYNGSAWTAGGNLNTGRGYFNIGEVGTQTAGIAFGGFSSALPVPTGMVVNTEEYDGTSWTNGGNLNTARYGLGSAGIQTAALGFGGTISGFVTTGNTEEYNGTSWTEVNNLNTARQYLAGCGTQTAAVGASSTGVEEWDGTNWTSNPNVLISGRGNLASAGTQTASIFFGGSPPTPGSTLTESYDGNSFSTAPSLGTGRFSLGGAGTQTSAIGFGGGNPSKLTNTEEFTGATVTTNPASNIDVS